MPPPLLMSSPLTFLFALAAWFNFFSNSASASDFDFSFFIVASLLQRLAINTNASPYTRHFLPPIEVRPILSL